MKIVKEERIKMSTNELNTLYDAEQLLEVIRCNCECPTIKENAKIAYGALVMLDNYIEGE